VTASLKLNGTDVPVCEIDASNYKTWSDQTNYQDTARSILNTSGAVVLLPRAPLAVGNYTVDITVNNTPYRWSFIVATPIMLTYTGDDPNKIIAGKPVHGQWTATGGHGGPYTFDTDNPGFPPGLSLSREGVFSGTFTMEWGVAWIGHVWAKDPTGQTSASLLWGLTTLGSRQVLR
jgi:hypothetical protein